MCVILPFQSFYKLSKLFVNLEKSKMKINLSIGMILICFLFTVEVKAASFNCVKAQTKTEHRICENLALNDADVKMATMYNIVRRLVPMGTRSEIQTEQIRWLQLRDECQDNLDCLNHVYQMRQQKLELHLDRIYKRGPY